MARIAVLGLPAHVTQRGNRCQQTFLRKDDYRAYLELMAEAPAPPEARPKEEGLREMKLVSPETETGGKITRTKSNARLASAEHGRNNYGRYSAIDWAAGRVAR